MRRRRRQAGPGADNLDSFLDVMTNTVGVLIFVLLFVALAAADARVLVRTPLFAGTPKTAVVFVAAGDRVSHLPLAEGDDAVAGLMSDLPRPTIWNLAAITERIYAFRASLGEYEVDLVGSLLSGSLGTRYTAVSPEVGERRTALRDPGSGYRRRLAEIDPDTEFAVFLVRPDGFAAFREARRLAGAAGLETGWEPVDAGEDIVFSSRGRALGVQ